jgi:hypothetical protein
MTFPQWMECADPCSGDIARHGRIRFLPKIGGSRNQILDPIKLAIKFRRIFQLSDSVHIIELLVQLKSYSATIVSEIRFLVYSSLVIGKPLLFPFWTKRSNPDETTTSIVRTNRNMICTEIGIQKMCHESIVRLIRASRSTICLLHWEKAAIAISRFSDGSGHPRVGTQ